MDIPKYLQMLSTETLWFARSDQMGDRFEGSRTIKTLEEYEIAVERVHIAGDKADLADQLLVYGGASNWSIYGLFHVFINSWHFSDYESAAMWQLYKRDFGIAITTTMARMDENLNWEGEIQIGQVKYVDYDTESFLLDKDGLSNGLLPFIHKRRSFEHEKEVRLVVFHGWGGEKTFLDSLTPSGLGPLNPLITSMNPSELAISNPLGMSIPADLEKLIFEVRIDPNAPSWFSKAIEDVTKRMGFHFKVIQSSLGNDPIY